MTDKDCVSYKTVAALAIVSLVVISVLSFPLIAHAEGTEETTESAIDTEQNERLNNLEIRLEELGYQINDAGTAIESINVQLETAEAERLTVSQQLELLLIGINDEIELLNTVVTDTASVALGLEQSLPVIDTDMKQLNQLTVSGNASIDAFSTSIKTDMQNISETSIEEFNTTLLRTNTLLSYLFVLLLFLLVLMIAFFIGSVIKNIINRNVL